MLLFNQNHLPMLHLQARLVSQIIEEKNDDDNDDDYDQTQTQNQTQDETVKISFYLKLDKYKKFKFM